ncbi:MAG: hypothetical protein ACJ0OB_04315 [Flavobacteriaceae bacterium]|tara:strand:- start:217 stop:450 length:234 start_codon:yes stop_codon:yes gene_type:complete
MKDFILKEFFWLILFSLSSLLLSLLFLSSLKLTYSEPFMNDIEKVFTFQLYFIGWIISLISLYIIRITISVVKKMIK